MKDRKSKGVVFISNKLVKQKNYSYPKKLIHQNGEITHATAQSIIVIPKGK